MDVGRTMVIIPAVLVRPAHLLSNDADILQVIVTVQHTPLQPEKLTEERWDGRTIRRRAGRSGTRWRFGHFGEEKARAGLRCVFRRREGNN